jgi:hypothetical protein
MRNGCAELVPLEEESYVHGLHRSACALFATPERSGRHYLLRTVSGFGSFGGVREIVKGWTPQAHRVTDDLTRARRQLASTFEARSSGMSPVARGADIVGALWHLKALFESDQAHGQTRTIRIFSDTVSETPNFNMPALLSSGGGADVGARKGEPACCSP